MKFLVLSLLFVTSFAQAAIPRFTKVNPNFYRGGQPETAADYQMLKKMGIKTIITLRTNDGYLEQDERMAHQLQMNFRSYPINSLSYPEESIVNGALRDLIDPRLQPVFLHCQHGKDRTGLVTGLYRVFFNKWTANQAYDEMKSLGFTSLLFGLDAYYWDHVKGR